jgi:mono/diheme cytochrome c family protein
MTAEVSLRRLSNVRAVPRILAWALALALATHAQAAAPAQDEKTRAGEQFFETSVRPILAEHCYKCHGPERQKANLRLDSLHALLDGGDSGPALVPGDAEHSLLVQVVNYGDDQVQMPPSKKLPDAQIAALTKWVKLGAPWPGADESVPKMPKRPAFEVTAKDREYWAFQPIRRPPTPDIKQREGVKNPIDAFVLAELEAKRLAPNRAANKRELIRRVYFDLIGLPPTPEAIDSFVADRSPQAYEKLIDHLLSLPQYGERWGRHWLDVVRFGQTNGYERDDEKPLAWRYRDYVIKAFNEDKPYDQFLIEQLAGDEISNVTDDSLIATGFYRLGIWDDEPDDPRMAEYEGLDDIMVATGAAFMGLTVGCARCHDHMFDPISQADYYRLLAFFRNIRPYSKPAYNENSPNYVPLGDRNAAAQWLAERKARLAPLEKQLEAATDKAAKKKLQQQIATIERQQQPTFAWALAVRESPPPVKPTQILIRGNAGTPGAQVEPAFPTVFDAPAPQLPPASPGNQSSGRRLALAQWLASSKNPLPARVMVNRIWQHHFGQGLVRSTNDFGKAGIPPTHPALLDWLAAEFIESGWSIKNMHKAITLSAAYQRSSHVDNASAVAVDPGNELLWRQNLRRLEAEAIRDVVLSVSGRLNPETGGRGFFPHLGGEVLAGASKPGRGWEISSDRDQDRRSVYTFIKRSMVSPSLDAFDYSNTTQPLGERPVTTVAPQSLMLLNDEFMQQQAAAFAQRLVKDAGVDPSKQIERAYRLAFGRMPTDLETRIGLDYLGRQKIAMNALRGRLTFRPDVPFSLDASFLGRLRPGDFLNGPREGWTYYRGRWVGGYEGIKTVDMLRGPFALWQGASFVDGTIEGRIVLHSASELGSVIFRATAEGDVFRGYEVTLDPREGNIALRRHGADVTLIADADLPIPTGRPMPIRIEMLGPRLKIWLNQPEPILDITDPQPLGDAGQVGVRTWGAALSLEGFTLREGGRQVDVASAEVPVGLGQESPGPLPGWRYFGGRWSVTADGGYGVLPEPGAKAIWDEATIGDGVVEAEFKLRGTAGDAGLVLRVNQPTDGVDALQGYNINFKTNSLRLGRHDNNWRQLASVPIKLPPNQWHRVKVTLDGPRIRIYVNGASQPQIDHVDNNPLPSGLVGMRTFNADCAFRNIKVSAAGKQWTADFKPTARPVSSGPKLSQQASRKTSEQRALESLCLLILNLNELLYVD